MAYLQYLTYLWSSGAGATLSGNELKLLLFLVHSAHQLGKNPIRHSSRYLANILGMSVNTLRAASRGLATSHYVSISIENDQSQYEIAGLTVSNSDTLAVSKIDTPIQNTTSTVSNSDTPVSNFDTPYTQFTVSNIDTPPVAQVKTIQKITSTVSNSDTPVSKIDTVTVSKIDTNYSYIYSILNKYIAKEKEGKQSLFWRALWDNTNFRNLALAEWGNEMQLAAIIHQFGKRNHSREYNTITDLETHFWNWSNKLTDAKLTELVHQLDKILKFYLNDLWRNIQNNFLELHPGNESLFKNSTVLSFEKNYLTLQLQDKQIDLLESDNYFTTYKKLIHAQFGKCKIQYKAG